VPSAAILVAEFFVFVPSPAPSGSHANPDFWRDPRRLRSLGASAVALRRSSESHHCTCDSFTTRYNPL